MSKADNEMTPKQSWAIFTVYGYDVRDSSLTFEEASDLIQASKEDFEGWDKDALIGVIQEAGGILKREPKKDWKTLYEKANAAGVKAATEHNPTPMVVQERQHPLGVPLGDLMMSDEENPVVKQYEPISDGVCGFAWIQIKPGNHSFANWLKKNNLARPDSYYGGVSIWVHEFRQSYEKKRAYAGAFAKVVNEEIDDEKFRAIAMDRLD